jgi:peptide-methionine (S)-S-oxide reductase
VRQTFRELRASLEVFFYTRVWYNVCAGAKRIGQAQTRLHTDRQFIFRKGYMDQQKRLETATLGGGCFWCVEAVFDDLKGVEHVESGYSGGTVARPSYEQVCTGKTGHAEVTQITFDPTVLSYADLLRIFFTVHDPTQLNRQGNDVGTQYRSVIFYHSDEQKRVAEQIIQEITAAKLWSGRIVTQVVPFDTFYVAEDYHQEYFANNPNQPYCQAIVAPKVKKFRDHYRDQLKK